MEANMLETLLAYHCAPALAGIKPANIATCRKDSYPDLKSEIARLNGELNCRDIYIEILCECENRALVMVYRRSVLEKHLQLRAAAAFLAQYGYRTGGGIDECLRFLKTRLGCDSFPHEIGVFLGYPLRDIYCFINHRDKGCLLVGEWRVYHDRENAEKLFRRFHKCRRALVRNVVREGKTLAQIFCAA